MKNNKLLVIGFDGMDYHLSKKTIGKYNFKNFKPILKLMKVKKAMTGPSWASFYTGLSEKEHGVSDLWGRNLGKSNSFNDIKEYVFWEVIKNEGHRILIENLPITPCGFPFDSNPRKEIANWFNQIQNEDLVRKQSQVQESFDRVKKMHFNEIIKKIEEDSFFMINSLELKDMELIFLQFSFLDRIGHIMGFMNDTIIKYSYNLVYSIIDKLYEITSPEYLIVVSDHGFGPNRSRHIYDQDAVLILNNDATKYFNDRISVLNRISKIFNLNNLKALVYFIYTRSFSQSFNLALFQIKTFNINYVEQITIFNKILKMFNISYLKPRRIKKKISEEYTEDEKELIEERLRRLGYIE